MGMGKKILGALSMLITLPLALVCGAVALVGFLVQLVCIGLMLASMITVCLAPILILILTVPAAIGQLITECGIMGVMPFLGSCALISGDDFHFSDKYQNIADNAVLRRPGSNPGNAQVLDFVNANEIQNGIAQDSAATLKVDAKSIDEIESQIEDLDPAIKAEIAAQLAKIDPKVISDHLNAQLAKVDSKDLEAKLASIDQNDLKETLKAEPDDTAKVKLGDKKESLLSQFRSKLAANDKLKDLHKESVSAEIKTPKKPGVFAKLKTKLAS